MLGFVDGGQGRLEDRRILFLRKVRPLGHDEAAGANVGVRDGAGGDRRQRLVGLDDLGDPRANLRLNKAQQDMDAKARRGRERTCSVSSKKSPRMSSVLLPLIASAVTSTAMPPNPSFFA